MTTLYIIILFIFAAIIMGALEEYVKSTREKHNNLNIVAKKKNNYVKVARNTVYVDLKSYFESESGKSEIKKFKEHIRKIKNKRIKMWD